MAHTKLDLISDQTARRIASDWHGGQWTPLYSLLSTGHITTGNGNTTEGEIAAALTIPDITNDDRYELTALLTYVQHHGTRDPIPGWSLMPWVDAFA